jgi:hypothetical protein
MFVKKVRSIETEHYFKWIIEANFYDFMTEKKKNLLESTSYLLPLASKTSITE